MSDRPVAERLQVKADRRLAVVGAPVAVDRLIGVPDRRAGLAEAAVAVLFAADRAALDAVLAGPAAALPAAAILWIAYPKRTSPLARDLDRDVIRAAVPAHGLDTVGQIAIDADWSALRLRRTG